MFTVRRKSGPTASEDVGGTWLPRSQAEAMTELALTLAGLAVVVAVVIGAVDLFS